LRTSSCNWPTGAKDRNALLCQLDSYSQPKQRGPHETPIPGLAERPEISSEIPDGCFLFKLARAVPLACSQAVLRPPTLRHRAPHSGRSVHCRSALLARKKRCGSGWFLRDFLYDRTAWHEQVDEKAARTPRVVKISHTVINGISLSTSTLAPASHGKNCPQLRYRVLLAPTMRRRPHDLFLHQIPVPELPAPYRHATSTDGKRKTRAPRCSLRAFKRAVAALFRREIRRCVCEHGACRRTWPNLTPVTTPGSDAATRRPVARALRSGRPRSHSAPASSQQFSSLDARFRQQFVSYVDAM